MQGRIKADIDCLALLAQKDTEIKSSEERWKNRCDTLEGTGAEAETGKLEEESAGGRAGGVQDTKKKNTPENKENSNEARFKRKKKMENKDNEEVEKDKKKKPKKKKAKKKKTD